MSDERPPALCEDCRYRRVSIADIEWQCAAKGYRACRENNYEGKCTTFRAREGRRPSMAMFAGIGIGAAITTLLTLLLGGCA